MISFVHANGTWTPARNPARPPHEPNIVQASGVTAGGVRYGYDPVTHLDTITLRWAYLTAGDVAALKTFFITTVKGMTNDFTLNDPWSNSAYLVSFAEPLITGTEQNYGGQEIILKLRRVVA